ncbi:hypothetical protein FHU13_005437 [Methylobacterium sp. R2-1]|nr:hypothetical protein [Methylobacterium sp. R2-1]
MTLVQLQDAMRSTCREPPSTATTCPPKGACAQQICNPNGFRTHDAKIEASTGPCIARDSGSGGRERVVDELSDRIANERHDAFALWHMMRAGEQGGELQFRDRHLARFAQRS